MTFRIILGRNGRKNQQADDEPSGGGSPCSNCDDPDCGGCSPGTIELAMPKVTFPSLKLKCGSKSTACEIPRPFWWPQAAGCVKSFACAGGVAVVQLCVRNTGPVARPFQVEVEPDAAKAAATVEPATFQLGPMEERRVIVRYKVPENHPSGCGSHLLIWVRGCLNHVVEWSIKTTSKVTESCHEVCVRDEPPYTLEWYHHFYCDHPCMKRENPNTTYGTAQST